MTARLTTAVVLALSLVLPAQAAGAWFGSTLADNANATYGCDQALILAPLGGVQLAPSSQSSCTYRHGGYLYSNRPTFLVPSSGRIERIRVKAGANPAKLRLTILTSSSRVNPFDGRDVPGTYTCCTARYVGPAFRPRPNAITTKTVKVAVRNVSDKRLQYRIHSSDGVALTAVGPGTLPLHIGPNPGGFDAGIPISTSYFPATRVGDPRVDGYSMTGVDLLLQWDFRRR